MSHWTRFLPILIFYDDTISTHRNGGGNWGVLPVDDDGLVKD